MSKSDDILELTSGMRIWDLKPKPNQSKGDLPVQDSLIGHIFKALAGEGDFPWSDAETFIRHAKIPADADTGAIRLGVVIGAMAFAAGYANDHEILDQDGNPKELDDEHEAAMALLAELSV